MRFSAFLPWLRIRSLAIYRLLTWLVLGVGLAFAVIVLSFRYWILPNIGHYREDIAQAVSRAADQRITIGKISGNWDGMRPELVLENVTVFDRDGRPALELSRVENTLSWLSLTTLDLRFHALAIYSPVLDIRRDARGVLSVAGIELKGGQGDGGFVSWLLRQREIAVHDAAVSWHDELRGAAPLELKNVELLIRNRGGRHRFGLHAVPPPQLAGPLDVRGDLAGRAIARPADWKGKLFARLDYADIAAWRAWIPFPVEFPQGAGALRLWLGFGEGRLTDVVADVRLADVKTRLARDLPELDLARLAGRIAWKAAAGSLEFSTTGLRLETQGGFILQPTDFLLRLGVDKNGKPLRGELKANALDLEPLAVLADRLPLGAGVRKRLVDLSPKGSLYDVAMRWSGDWREPQQLSVRGRFDNIGFNRFGDFPGFSGVSGNIDGSENGGSLYLSSSGTTLDMPLVFRDPLEFDTLTAQIGWARSGGGTELRLSSISFSNPHLAGTLFGSYRIVTGGKGVIDLTGNLTRADARYASRYVPLVIGKSERDWLDTAFLAGQSNEVTLRLKGNLDDFPFPDNKGGVFRVAAKVTGAVLDYATGWPKIENIAGELVFQGKRMDVYARQGTILGARLGKVHAEIPDLKYTDEILRVTGEATGPTSGFLQFIEKSPVLDMIDRFTEGMRAQGDGKLDLKLEIPLRAHAASKIAGTYQFINNQIVGDADLPPIEQVNGRLEFTESSVRVPGARGIFLGGPVTVTAATQPDATVRVNLRGRANIDNLRRSTGSPQWAQNLRGATDWRGMLVLRKKLADLSIESNLQGVASDLPEPFAKTAEEAVPLRYQRRYLGPQQDQIDFSYGEVVSARLERRVEGGRSTIRRGTIRFGGAAAPPERDGVWASGTLKSLDLGRWLAFSKQSTDSLQAGLAGLDLKIGDFDAFGRHFQEVAVSATTQDGVWQSTLSSREFDGTATWQPQGRGKLTARFKTLVIPPVADTAPATQTAGADRQNLPALDVTAEQFQFKGKLLGRLELAATPEGRDWRIDSLRITNPEGALTANGLWQNTPAQSRTQVTLHLDVSDIGKLLTRLGYPRGVQRGSAKLDGTLAWPDGPQEFDYPALSGNLTLNAEKGQFVKLEPGIGKLLGILSLQALPRRITLDFRDIFSEGFAFDQIIGVVKINHGIATTDTFGIQGPSARIIMNGQVDLARETQNLSVKITPSLSDSVSIASALLGGPVAGVATFLAQKVLKDPLGQIASYEYRITGTWSDPQVSKVGHQAPTVPDNPQ